MTENASSESEEPKRLLSVRTRWIALGVLLILMIIAMFAYWQYRVYYPSTENAYVGSDIVRIAPEINGVVTKVYVDTDATVKQNDPLFDLDATLYEAALRGAQAQFDAAAAASGTEADDLKAAAKTLDEKRQALDSALSDYQESKSGSGSGNEEKTWQDALKAYDDAEAKFVEAQNANLTVTTPTVKLRAAAAQLQKAMHDRVKTHVLAPAGGAVSNVQVRPGTTVQAGHPVFAIVEGDKWWVDANFKETDLARIHSGQEAKIKLDMYPGVTFKGVVESISSGSGATFSVLPAQNASGNWVKVTQRFPVRIRIPNPQDQAADDPLRVGATATVTVDTTEDDDKSGDDTGTASANAPAEDAQAAQ